MSPHEFLFGHTVILPVGMGGAIRKNINKIHEFAWEKLNISLTNMARDCNSKIQQKSYYPGIEIWVFYPNQ